MPNNYASDVSMRDEDDDGKDGNDDDEDDDGEDEDNDDVNQVDSVTPQSPEMGNKSAKRGTDMRPIMGDTPAAEKIGRNPPKFWRKRGKMMGIMYLQSEMRH